MSLTGEDLLAVRKINSETIAPIEGKVDALQNDVKEIYYMIAKMEKSKGDHKRFLKFNVEQKIKSVYADLQLTAKEAGVTLPR